MPPATQNQTPEQIARDQIDKKLAASGWHVQDKDKINFNAGPGIAVREYLTDIGEADYVLFVERQAAGVIEAKPDDWGHKITTVEEQSEGYASAKLKWVSNKMRLPFVYESTGIVTRFTNGRDPKPRSREVFNFPRPETMAEWLSKPQSLRARLHNIPLLDPAGFRDCQIRAIENLEKSFQANKPRALIQMATGAGKTFTAITSVYRLLKFADAKRILFLVDTKNLGEQAEQEFMSYLPNDDNRIVSFNHWLGEQDFRHRVVCAGNHDRYFENAPQQARELLTNATYLENTGATLDGVAFWGSPYTPEFMNWAYMYQRGSGARYWELIPDSLDVLITHGPPLGILDQTAPSEAHLGCAELLDAVKEKSHEFTFSVISTVGLERLKTMKLASSMLHI